MSAKPTNAEFAGAIRVWNSYPRLTARLFADGAPDGILPIANLSLIVKRIDQLITAGQ